MSKENKMILTALLLGVWLIVTIHAVPYFHGKWRLQGSRGVGTLTDKTIAQERSRNLKHGVVELVCWVVGLGLAKVALVVGRRRREAGPGPRDGSGAAGNGDPGG